MLPQILKIQYVLLPMHMHALTDLLHICNAATYVDTTARV